MTHSTYDHIQRGFFHWILYVLAGVQATLAFTLFGEVGESVFVTRVILGIMSVVMLVLASCFQHLRVSNESDALRISFGPVPILRRRIAYADIVSVNPSRSSFIDGWGIHWNPVRGWIWNIRGRDVVEFELSDGRLRVGTNDPDGLITHLQDRIGSRAVA